jgi:tRNA1(Val) A37 N6-methylase TrmN6
LDVTEGTLLGGRLIYHQPRAGYRTGLEPVLLAASVPARSGEAVLEAGTGAGAGLLSLLSRVSGVAGLGLERDQAMAALARQNLAANGFLQATIQAETVEAWQPDRGFDHAFANPPWHDADGTPSPVPAREAAKRGAPGLIGAWTAALAKCLRPRGTLSLIVPAAALAETVLALTAAKCPEITLLPLWPHAGGAAKLIILRGVRLGRGASSLHAGLVLHESNGQFSSAANAILRDGFALE